jgi:hypothetical protein
LRAITSLPEIAAYKPPSASTSDEVKRGFKAQGKKQIEAASIVEAASILFLFSRSRLNA